MGVYVPPGSGQASLHFSCVGVTDPIVITFGIDWSGTMTAQQSANAIRTAVASTGKWLHPSNYSASYTFVRTDVVHGSGDFADYGSAPSGDAGQLAAGATVPVNCAVLVRKSTVLGGRKHRGRMYLPPMFFTESDVTPSGVIASASVTALQTKLTTFLTDLNTAAIPMVLLHSEEELPPTAITGLSVQALLATQRRRMR